MTTLLFFVFLLFISIYLIIGIWHANKIHKTYEFFTPKHRLNILLATAGLIGAQLGAGLILGTAEHTYLYGWYGLIYPLGLSLGFLLLHHKFAEMWYNFNLSTSAQIFEKIYKSPGLRTFAGCIFVISFFGILCAEANALQMIFPIKPIANSLFLISWITLIAYTVLGGLNAVLSTDLIQTSLVYGIFIVLVLALALFEGPSLPTTTSLLSTISPLPKHVFGLQSIISIFFLPALFSIIGQELTIYFFRANSVKTARYAASYSTILLIAFMFIPVIFGIYARAFHITPGINPLIAVLEKLFPELAIDLTLCAIYSAILSVSDSILCAMTAHISHDILKLSNSKKSLLTVRIITCCIGLAALVSSFFLKTHILTILFLSYNLTVSTLFVPIMFAFFLPSKYISKKAAWASTITGLASVSFMKYRLHLFQYLPLNLFLAALAYILMIVIENNLLISNKEGT